MVCFQNSRNRSSTAREEPAVCRINDVNPRNGSATSLANSQFSPSPRSPLSCPTPQEPPFPLSRRFRACPLRYPWNPPSSVRVRPRHDPKNLRRDPAAGPLPSLVAYTPALSFAVFTCLHHPLTIPPLLIVSVTTLFARFFGVDRRRFLSRHPAHGISK